mmetsp:Transcript_17990/g.38350  ORF Transcript_17990/g.38350 Transcript_17990/m.38350 type:complete len:80 (+) Transcript_17990:106-345(+)
MRYWLSRSFKQCGRLHHGTPPVVQCPLLGMPRTAVAADCSTKARGMHQEPYSNITCDALICFEQRGDDNITKRKQPVMQ